MRSRSQELFFWDPWKARLQEERLKPMYPTQEQFNLAYYLQTDRGSGEYLYVSKQVLRERIRQRLEERWHAV